MLFLCHEWHLREPLVKQKRHSRRSRIVRWIKDGLRPVQLLVKKAGAFLSGFNNNRRAFPSAKANLSSTPRGKSRAHAGSSQRQFSPSGRAVEIQPSFLHRPPLALRQKCRALLGSVQDKTPNLSTGITPHGAVCFFLPESPIDLYWEPQIRRFPPLRAGAAVIWLYANVALSCEQVVYCSLIRNRKVAPPV